MDDIRPQDSERQHAAEPASGATLAAAIGAMFFSALALAVPDLFVEISLLAAIWVVACTVGYWTDRVRDARRAIVIAARAERPAQPEVDVRIAA